MPFVNKKQNSLSIKFFLSKEGVTERFSRIWLLLQLLLKSRNDSLFRIIKFTELLVVPI